MVQFQKDTLTGDFHYSMTATEAEAFFLILKGSADPKRKEFLLPFTEFAGENIDTLMGEDFPLLIGTNEHMSEYAFDYTMAMNYCMTGAVDHECVKGRKIHAIKEFRVAVGTEKDNIQKANKGIWVPSGSCGLKAAKEAVEFYWGEVKKQTWPATYYTAG